MMHGSHSSRCAAIARSTGSGSVPSRCSVTSSTNSRQAIVTRPSSSTAGRGAGNSATALFFPLGAAVHVLQPGPQPGPATVQQDPLVGGADAEPLAHLHRREAVDVAQLDHGALPGREFGQGGPEFPADFARHGGVL